MRTQLIIHVLMVTILGAIAEDSSDGLCVIDAANNIEGCPQTIPIVLDDNILAGKTWHPKTMKSKPNYYIRELGCQGGCKNWYANTKTKPGNTSHPFVSVMVNPGCTLYVFKNHDFTGDYSSYKGPITIINPKIESPITKCDGKTIGSADVPCVGSMLWSCEQTYPKCETFHDAWQNVTEIDNSKSSVSTTFAYEKTVGTEFSQSIQRSKNVSTTASAEISLDFWKIVAKIGYSKTTTYDWSRTDVETKSETHSYTVSVNVPPKMSIYIQEVVGHCVGSRGSTKIYTQMFRVLDYSTGKVLQSFYGNVAHYKLSVKKGKGKGRK